MNMASLLIAATFARTAILRAPSGRRHHRTRTARAWCVAVDCEEARLPPGFFMRWFRLV